MKKFLLLAVFGILIASSVAFSQTMIKGQIIDEQTHQPIFGAIVYVDSVPKVKTDFDGWFKTTLSQGDHQLLVTNTYGNYSAKKVLVSLQKDEEQTIQIKLARKVSVNKMEGFTVVGRRTTTGATTFEGAYEMRSKETTFSNAVPKKQMSNTGVSNAGGAIKMVAGATVNEGKNVYIRGLGDRYTKVMFNGVPLPSLNPKVNAVQVDIFPTVLIDNITVYKTFSPELSGDFVGGLVDISSIDFPAKETMYAKVGWGYSSNATFNNRFLQYKGGKLDFLGFDDGTRKLPIRATKKIPNPAANSWETTKMTQAFSDVMAPFKAAPFLNQSYAFMYGNKLELTTRKKEKVTYGYTVALNYSMKHTFYKDAIFNEYRKSPDKSQTELYLDRGSKGEVAENNALWSALITQSIRFKRSKINLSLFHTQNGENTAANFSQINTTSNPSTLKNTSLRYSQRSISNINLNGLHYMGESGKWKLKWTVSPTYSTIKDPDMRTTLLEEIERADGTVYYLLNGGVGAEIRRTFRDMKEYNVFAKTAVTYEFKQWQGKKSEVIFGLSNSYKNRSFGVNTYVFQAKGGVDPSGNPDWFFQEENAWKPTTQKGVYGIGQYQPANNYKANQLTSAFFVKNQLPLTQKLTATYGVRVERNSNRYTGEANDAAYNPEAMSYNNEEVLSSVRILPSINLIYRLKKATKNQTNLRLAYANTVARPTFREISISQIHDPIQGRTYLGNIDLKETFVYNYDFRVEHFFGKTELFAASVFYKKFIDPIAVMANFAAPNEFRPVNTGEANLMGAEIEIRKQIGFIDNEKIDLTLGANFTYIYSRVNMNKVKTTIGNEMFTEKEIREKFARKGEKVGDYRALFGQSPFVVNGMLTFVYRPQQLMINVNYNVQGKRLAVIGVGAIPDVYELPTHQLNLKVSKQFGKQKLKPWKVSLEANNLLNRGRTKRYFSYKDDAKVFSYLNPGISFSVSVAYTFQ